MEAITVVRIEKDGTGIFCSQDTNPTQSAFKSVRIRHNEFDTPFDEGMDFTKDWFCAYKSVEQFQMWIKTEELEFFVEIGFRVYMIEVTNYQVGNFQVIFTKDSVKTKTDITNIFI